MEFIFIMSPNVIFFLHGSHWHMLNLMLDLSLFRGMIQMEFKPMAVYYMDGKQSKTSLAFWFCFLIGIHLKYSKKNKENISMC